MTAVFLTGAAVLQDGGWLHGHGVLVQGGLIAGVLPEAAIVQAAHIGLPPGSLLSPGLVDVQVNGGGGVLFNDAPTAQAARGIAAAHRRLGTTSILPTLITDTAASMRQAADAVRATTAQDGIAGIHFEGPFLSPARPGVHDRTLFRSAAEPDLRLLETLAAELDGTVLLTLAPEHVNDATLRRLAEADVVLSAGHSEASFDRTTEAIEAGLRGFTHVFNAMPPAAARDPGLAAAALLDPNTWCGVIADGVHVHPAMLRLLLAAKPAGRVMLVSDAMPSVGTAAASFQLQGRTILRRGGMLTTPEGTLAGADISLADAVRCCVRLLGLSSAAALTMATEAPAAFLRQQARIGRIAPGCRADLLLLSGTLDVLGTWLGGQWQGPGVLPQQAAA